MFSKMLKLTTVFLVLMAFFVVSSSILSINYEDEDIIMVRNKKCGTPTESSVVPEKDPETGASKGCDQYGQDDCTEDASGIYTVVEADGCTVDADEEIEGYLTYVWNCVVEKQAIPHGTVNCAWKKVDTSGNGAALFSCQREGEYSNKNTTFKHKCDAKRIRK